MKTYDLKEAIRRAKQRSIQIAEERDFQEIVQEGIRRGMQRAMQEAQETALKLLKKNVSIEKVSQVTGFSKLKVRKLKAKVNMEACDFTIKGAFERGRQEGIQIGEKKGIQKVVQQGIQQQFQEIALKLLEMGMSIDEVLQVTGLSKLKIRKLQAKVNIEAYDFTIKGAIKRGQQEGMQKGMQQLQEAALKLLEMGMNIEKVSQVTGLSKLKIRKLQAEAKK